MLRSEWLLIEFQFFKFKRRFGFKHLKFFVQRLMRLVIELKLQFFQRRFRFNDLQPEYPAKLALLLQHEHLHIQYMWLREQQLQRRYLRLHIQYCRLFVSQSGLEPESMLSQLLSVPTLQSAYTQRHLVLQRRPVRRVILGQLLELIVEQQLVFEQLGSAFHQY